MKSFYKFITLLLRNLEIVLCLYKTPYKTPPLSKNKTYHNQAQYIQTLW